MQCIWMFLDFPPTEEAIETVHLNIKIRKENRQDILGNQHEPVGDKEDHIIQEIPETKSRKEHLFWPLYWLLCSLKRNITYPVVRSLPCSREDRGWWPSSAGCQLLDSMHLKRMTCCADICSDDLALAPSSQWASLMILDIYTSALKAWWST